MQSIQSVEGHRERFHRATSAYHVGYAVAIIIPSRDLRQVSAAQDGLIETNMVKMIDSRIMIHSVSTTMLVVVVVYIHVHDSSACMMDTKIWDTKKFPQSNILNN